MRKTKFKCKVCGLVTSGRKPRGGDGTFYFPARHEVNGKPCEGNYEEAEWVIVDARHNATSESK